MVVHRVAACGRIGGQAGNPQFHRPKFIIIFFFLIHLYIEGAGKARVMIQDFLAGIYPWTKALHVVSVIAWMAGLFYLPRLFVYHVEQVERGSPTDAMFQVMERRLLKAIINPASFATWIFGLMLVFTPQAGVYWDEVWPWTKAAAVIGMTIFHHWLGRRRKDFVTGTNRVSGRSYRIANEVPTLLMLVIVFSVIVKW